MSYMVRPSLKLFSKCIKVPNLNYNWAISTRYLQTSFSLNADGIPLNMPSLSPTMVEGKIVKWLKQEGDPIQPGDVLCDIETDKAVVSFEVDEEGVLAKILVGSDSDTIKIGTMIAVMAPEGEDWQSITIPASDGGSPDASAAVSSAPASATDARKFGPSVRLLLEQYGLSAHSVSGFGPHGELLKGDVLKHIALNRLDRVPVEAVAPPTGGGVATSSAPSSAKSSPAAVIGPPSDAPFIDLELTNMRRTIAKRLTQSKTGIAHSYGTLECRMDGLLALRKKFKADGVSVSVNDLLVKAVSVALITCPAVNCVWHGDKLVQSSSVDVSVAVATPAGLITPIVRNADQLGVLEISSTVKELAARAKENKLKPEEFMGGTFTISNLGMFGITEFSAIINPPQCGILAVGGSQLVLGADGSPETRMRATLSYDRLAIDDDAAGEFLSALSQLLEDPTQLLLGRAAQAGQHPLQALL